MADMRIKKRLAVVPKHPGVATTMRVVEIGGVDYLDIRDLVNVGGDVQAGRGYLFPVEGKADQLASLGAALVKYADGLS